MRVAYKGKIQRTMAEYEAIETLEQYVDYDIIDHPVTFITNDQMAFALTCSRLFPVGSIYICSDDGEYTKGHTYKIILKDNEKVWQDISLTLDNELYIIEWTSPLSEENLTLLQNYTERCVIIFNGLALYYVSADPNYIEEDDPIHWWASPLMQYEVGDDGKLYHIPFSVNIKTGAISPSNFEETGIEEYVEKKISEIEINVDAKTIEVNTDNKIQAIGLTDGTNINTFEEIDEAITIERL